MTRHEGEGVGRDSGMSLKPRSAVTVDMTAGFRCEH